MKITLDMLINLKACKEGISFFKKHFPEGATIEQLFEVQHLPESFIHWGLGKLPLDIKEKELCYKKLNINHSKAVVESSNIQDSALILNSYNIKNSTMVYASTIVENSTDIFHSSRVFDSSYVYDSKFVYNSNNIGASSNVTGGSNIFNSIDVENSQDIKDSSHIVSSSGLYLCNNLSFSHFSARCNNGENLIFCQDCQGTNMLFNQPVSEQSITRIKHQIELMRLPELTMGKVTSDRLDGEMELVNNYQQYFANLPQDFWEWVKTVPNYDPMIMYMITLNPDLI